MTSIALQLAKAKLSAADLESWKAKALAWHADHPAMREFVTTALALEQVQALHDLTAEVRAQRESTDTLIDLLESMAVEEPDELKAVEEPEEPKAVEMPAPSPPKPPKQKREKPPTAEPSPATDSNADATKPPKTPAEPARTRSKKKEPAT